MCSDPAMIADMEGNDGHVCSLQGRTGPCIVFNDGTGSQWPKPLGTSLAEFSPLEACRGTSAVALHTKGTSFTSWGAGTALHFADGVWDASAYSGITFWARSTTFTTLSVGIVSAETQDVTYGGTCVPSGGKQCNDHFVALRSLTPTWMMYTISFSELKQVGWGVPAPTSTIDTKQLSEINIVFPKGAPFDVWLDDVSFMN